MHDTSRTGDERGQRGFGLVNLTDHAEEAFVPFHLAHLNLLAWRDFDRQYTVMLPHFEQRMQEVAQTSSLSATLVHHGRVMACMGVVASSEKSGYVWLFGSKYLEETDSLKTYLRQLQKLIDTLHDEHGMTRVQTVCVADDAAGCRWVEALGFEREGVLRQYDHNGKDYVMYANLKKATPTPTTQG